MGPRAILDGCGKSRPHQNSIPRTVQPRSESLYRLRYPTHFYSHTVLHLSKLQRRSVKHFSFFLVRLLYLRFRQGEVNSVKKHNYKIWLNDGVY